MANPSSNPAILAHLPRFIENLNAMAREHGMTAEMFVEPYSDHPEIRLWAKWRGTREQLLALAKPVRSYHLPLSRGSLYIPGGSQYYAPKSLLGGIVSVNGDEVLFEVDFGPSDFTVADIAGVEVISYVDEVLYHGPPAALIGLGIERARLPMGKRGARSGYDYKATWPTWSARRQPDGTILYRVESPAGLRRRRKEHEEPDRQARIRMVLGLATTSSAPTKPPRPSHMRLVVNNRADPDDDEETRG
jgi:hypothetical protein